MNKDFLKVVSKENKKEFLSKLQSGKFTLGEVYEPQPQLNFDLQKNGLYKCQKTGKELTSEEIESLPGYRMNIELVSDRLQVANLKPPDSIIKIPFTQEEYLNSLLKNKSDKNVIWDEANEKRPFKCVETGVSYSFKEMQRLSIDENFSFCMDEATAKKYIEELEKWC